MELVERLAALIGDGAVSRKELAARAGVTERSLLEAVQMDGRFAVVGDSYVFSPALLDGTVWTVPIDPADASGESIDTDPDEFREVPGGFVRADPHLAPLSWWLVTDFQPRVDAEGNEIDQMRCVGMWLDGRDTDVIHARSADWLDGVGPFAAFHVTADGIRVESVDRSPAPDAAQVAAVRAAYDQVATEHESTGFGGAELSPRFCSLTPLLNAAAAHDRQAFVAVPIAPVPELVATAGLELRNSLVAETGFDWDELRSWQNRNRLRTYYGLTDDQLDGLTMMVGACELYAEQGDDALGATDEERVGALVLFAHLLADAELASAFLQETQQRGLRFHALQSFADAIAECVADTDADQSGVTWLRVICLQTRGEWVEANALVDAVVDEHTTNPLLLIEAAYNAADRSQPARTRQLLARAGVGTGDDESNLPVEAERLLAEIQPFVGRRQRTDVKRNDPCPCGSGRKYKVCHLGKETLTLDERAPWLYEKGCRFTRLFAPDVASDTAWDLAEHAPDLHESLVDLPFVTDIVLHEYDGWDEFLDQRGELLPDDERHLAESWLGVPRAVYAVESTRRGGAGAVGGELRLRNVETDEIVVVSGVQLDDRIDEDQYFVGRPLPVGDTYRSMSGFFPIDASRADEVIAAIAAGETAQLLGILAQELTLD